MEKLGLLNRDEEAFGDVLTHDPFSAVLMTWYRNNVVHTLALPSLIACLMVKRRRPLGADQLHAMINLIYPYLAGELSCDPGLTDEASCLRIMTELRLLQHNGRTNAAPDPEQPQHLQLTLLANLVSQTLERMFIVINQLAHGPISRDELLQKSQLVAQRISRLYGINAPEFSDQRLFDQFINALMKTGMVCAGDDDLLGYDPMIKRVLRAAEYVIDPQIRHGVLSVSNHA